MRRIYRFSLIVLLVALIGCGAWYVYSCYNERGSYKDATLVYMEGGMKDGSGNGISKSSCHDNSL